MYRKEINIITVILLVITVSSCSKWRISGSKGAPGAVEMSSVKFLAELERNNITSKAVSVNRIVINYENESERRRLRANMKTDGRGNILLSIRTFGGLEAARILIGKDTVKIADRINRVYYTGNTERLAEKYGLRYDFINLFFGDYEKKAIRKKRISCENGRVKLNVDESDIEYLVDCTIKKIVEISGSSDSGEEKFNGYFDDFRKENGFLYPGNIIWKINKGRTTLNIKMESVKSNENRELIFNVGSNYERRNIK